MKIKQIKMIIKRTQWQEVEISDEAGYDMPDSAQELIRFSDELRDDFRAHLDDNMWTDGDFELESFVIEEL